MLCHLQVVIVHLFNYSISLVSYVDLSQTTDESLHFLQKTKTLSHALQLCKLPVYIVMQLLKDILYHQIFFAKIYKKIRVLRVKKEEIQKERAHISLPSLSLLVDQPTHFDFPERMCMHQSLSLLVDPPTHFDFPERHSLSLSL